MLCARELAGMLINLFPTSSWEAHSVHNIVTKEVMSDLETQHSVLDRLEVAFRMRPRRRAVRRPNAVLSRLNQTNTTDDNSDLLLGIESEAPSASASTSLIQDHCCGDFEEPTFPQFTGDYIGSLILNLLHKLIREDMDAFAATKVAVGTNSVTMQCFNFALETYGTMAASDAFKPVNRAILSRRLLTIICNGLWGIFAKSSSSSSKVGIAGSLDVADVLDKLLTSSAHQFGNENADDCDKNPIDRDHRANLCLLFVLIVQRCVLRWSGMRGQHTPASIPDNPGSGDGDVLQRLSAAVNTHAVFVVETLLFIEREDGTGDFAKCNNILLRTVEILRSTIQNAHTPAPLSSLNRRHSRQNITAVRKQRSHQSLRNGCGQRHHHHASNNASVSDGSALACALEHVLLMLAERVTVAVNLRRIYRHFQHNVQCCCNTPDVLGLERLLRNALKTDGTPSFCFQFMRNNVLCPTFGGHPGNGTLPCNMVCEPCDKRRITFAADAVFVGLYSGLTTHFESTESNDSLATTLPLLLRHLAKVAKYLPFDMACRVMAEVLLPQFRVQKATVANSRDRHTVTLSLCLTAFLCYLRDIRLIKAFFNDDNIQHLSDLMIEPQLASLVCCLVRIGVDNATFLGENCGEQQALADRLQRLQTIGVHIVTDALAVLFRAISDDAEIGCGDSGLKMLRMPDKMYGSVVEKTGGHPTANVFLERLEKRELTVNELLKLAVVYWHQMLQLLRRSPTVMADSFVVQLGVDGLTAMVQNTLTCFLHSRPIQIDVESSGSRIATLEMGSDGLNEKTRFVWVSSKEDASFANTTDENSCIVRCPIFASSEDDNAGEEPIAMYSSQPTAERERFNMNRNGTLEMAPCTAELIYDLRLAKCEQHLHMGPMTHSLMYSTFSESNASSVDLTRFAALGTADGVDDDASRRHSSDSGTSDTSLNGGGGGGHGSMVHSVFQYISDNVWDMLFRANAVRAQAAEDAAQRQQVERSFGNSVDRLQIVEAAENKHMFLQLFEIACGVLMCDYVNETIPTAAATTGADGSDGGEFNLHFHRIKQNECISAAGQSCRVQGTCI